MRNLTDKECLFFAKMLVRTAAASAAAIQKMFVDECPTKEDREKFANYCEELSENDPCMKELETSWMGK